VSTIVITAYTILAHIPSHLQPSPTRSLSPYTSNADLGYLLAHFHLGPSQPRPRHRGSATSPPFAFPDLAAIFFLGFLYLSSPRISFACPDRIGSHGFVSVPEAYAPSVGRRRRAATGARSGRVACSR
jgi:hypothetical protein